jgi:hypothetical protein
VALVPTTTGPIASGIYVSGANATQADVALTGIGIPDQGVVYDVWRADFGSVMVGQASAARTFTVTNVGTSSTSVALSSDNEIDQFAITQDQCSGATLAAGASCTFRVALRPLGVGQGIFARIIASSASNDAIAVLTGAGI